MSMISGSLLDRGQLALYVEAVFEPTDAVELRAVREDRGTGHAEHVLAREIPGDAIARWIEDHCGVGWLPCCGPNPRIPGQRSGAGGTCDDADVLLARCLFVDFDDAMLEVVEERIEAAGLVTPTLLVNSGRVNGWHCYWRFDEPITDLELWKGLTRRMIALLGSDHKIKNPSRIMRLPGTINHKRGGGRCVVHRQGPRWSNWQALKIEPVAEEQQYLSAGTPSSSPADIRALGRETLAFIHAGAAPGQRNSELFKAAADLSGNNFTIQQAIELLVPKARESGLPDWEIERTICSAYRKPRNPTVPERVVLTEEEMNLSAKRGLPPTLGGAPPPEGRAAPGQNPEGPEPGTREPEISFRPRSRVIFSNVIRRHVVEDGKRRSVSCYKSAEQLGREMYEALGEWPRRSTGTGLFVLKDDGKGEPAVWTISNPAELFAVLHDRADTMWHSGECEDLTTGHTLSAPTKQEFFEWCRDNLGPCYDAIHQLPHHPPRPASFYMPVRLPKPTGERLTELVSKLNPATEDDRRLMLAALLTPGWGGDPGLRPAFVFTSDYGQGAGKTETAKLFGAVWGGACQLNYEETWDKVAKGIASSDDWMSRVFLFDNVKGRFGSGALEAALTATTLTGHRMYVGRVSRPNDVTFYITFNMPEMTRDLAQRSVVIKLGPPRHESDFATWAIGFIREHRLQLVSDLLAMLEAPPVSVIAGTQRDRWKAWQDAVLSRVPGADRLAEIIAARRPVADADSDDAEEIIRAVSRYMLAMGLGHGAVEEVSTVALIRAVTEARLWVRQGDESELSNAKKCMAFIKARLTGRGVLLPTGDGGRPKRCRVDGQGRPTEARDASVAPLYRWVWEKADDVLQGDRTPGLVGPDDPPL